MNFFPSVKVFYHYCLQKITKGGGIFLFLIFIIFFSFLFFSHQKAQAARIALTPLVFELTANKGETIEDQIRVMNPSYEETITLKMESEDFFPSDEEGRIRLQTPTAERAPFSLSSWITFEPEVFTLAPREEKAIKFRISPPEYAEPGGHYASILASTQNVQGPGGTGVGIVQRVASLVLLTIPGEMKEDLSLIEFQTSKSFFEYGPVNFVGRFENKGTVHLRPQAKITIRNFFGQKVGEISVEPRSVLPNAIRKIEAQWNKKWLWWGRYTAEMNGTFGKNNTSFNSMTIVFWAFPWKAGLAILGAILLILLFFIFTRKRWGTALKILIKGESALSNSKK